ncbi:MAG: hydantoinase B/oxoprolinase family protein [Actinobacteria bacterium]|nr:hydantoinase B/oxoprolinase family protein [Actinomycetota bacterium]
MRPAFAAAVAQIREACPWDPDPVVAVADGEGRLLSASDGRGVASLESVARFVRRSFAADWGPGSAAVSNDPFVGAADICEMTLVSAVPDGLALARVRVPDLGGFDFGGVAPGALDVWGEGARFPALRIAIDAGQRAEGRALLRLNSRTPRLLDRALDALGEAAACGAEVLGERSALESERLEAAAAASAALGALRPGTYAAEVEIDVPGQPPGPAVRAALTVGEEIELSFSESDPAVERPLNSTAPLTTDCSLAEIESGVAGFRAAPGALEAISVDAGAGTIAGAELPATTSLARFLTEGAIRAAVQDVLRQAGGAERTTTWWEAEGSQAFAQLIDPADLRLRAERVAWLVELEQGDDDD